MNTFVIKKRHGHACPRRVASNRMMDVSVMIVIGLHVCSISLLLGFMSDKTLLFLAVSI